MAVKAHVRPIDPTADLEVELVARRMRDTWIEVLGQAEGAGMSSHEWLVERVLWHLAPEQSGQVFVSENSLGEITGHTIVRVDRDLLAPPRRRVDACSRPVTGRHVYRPAQ